MKTHSSRRYKYYEAKQIFGFKDNGGSRYCGILAYKL